MKRFKDWRNNKSSFSNNASKYKALSLLLSFGSLRIKITLLIVWELTLQVCHAGRVMIILSKYNLTISEIQSSF